MYDIEYSKKATKDIQRLKTAKLAKKAKQLVDILEENPLQFPPAFEALSGNFDGLYSRRISGQHRLVYEIDEDRMAVFIISMWSHYEF